MLRIEVALASDILFILFYSFGLSLVIFGTLVHISRGKRKLSLERLKHWRDKAFFPYWIWYTLLSNDNNFENQITEYKSNLNYIHILGGFFIIVICAFLIILNIRAGIERGDIFLLLNIILLLIFVPIEAIRLYLFVKEH